MKLITLSATTTLARPLSTKGPVNDSEAVLIRVSGMTVREIRKQSSRREDRQV